jgi:hypothetical protein
VRRSGVHVGEQNAVVARVLRVVHVRGGRGGAQVRRARRPARRRLRLLFELHSTVLKSARVGYRSDRVVNRAGSWRVGDPKHGGPNGGPKISIPLGGPLGPCGAPKT